LRFHFYAPLAVNSKRSRLVSTNSTSSSHNQAIESNPTIMHRKKAMVTDRIPPKAAAILITDGRDRNFDVCFSPESGRVFQIAGCPLRANSRLSPKSTRARGILRAYRLDDPANRH
jgi:hypothetical protein